MKGRTKKQEEKLMKTKKKFYLLKDKVLDIIADEPPSPQKIKPEVVGLVRKRRKNRRRATRINKKNKINVDKKPVKNIRSLTQQHQT